jgi:hypothetical protein
MRVSTHFAWVLLLALGASGFVGGPKSRGQQQEPDQDRSTQPDPAQREARRIQQEIEEHFENWRQRSAERQQQFERQRRKLYVIWVVIFAVCGAGGVECGRRSLSWLDRKPLVIRVAAALLIVGAWLAVGVAFVLYL